MSSIKNKFIKPITNIWDLLPTLSWLVYALIVVVVVGLQVLIDIRNFSWSIPLLKDDALLDIFGIYNIIWLMIIPILIFVAEKIASRENRGNIFNSQQRPINLQRQMNDLDMEMKIKCIFVGLLIVIMLIFIVPKFTHYLVITSFLVSVWSMFLSFNLVHNIIKLIQPHLYNSHKKEDEYRDEQAIEEVRNIINEINE